MPTDKLSKLSMQIPRNSVSDKNLIFYFLSRIITAFRNGY